MHDLFVSYSYNDSAHVAAVVDCLKRRGLGVWFDQEAVRGVHDVVREIDRALESCRLFLLFASRSYFDSEWATAEYRAALYMALSRRNLTVVVVKLDDSEPPPLLSSLHYVAFTTPAEVCAEVAALFPLPPGDAPPGARPDRGLDTSWAALEDAFLYTLVDALFDNLGRLREQSGVEAALRVGISERLFFELKLSVPLLRNEVLMADLQSEWRVFKILKKTVGIHTETIRKGGLGIFQPAFEITLEEKLAELNLSRAKLDSQLSAVSPVLRRFDAGSAEGENR